MKIKLRNQKGFTLIEIIAVLIILGILAAVAVPKYMDLTADAADKACIQGVAEGMSRCTSAHAQLMLSSNGVNPTAAVVLAKAAPTTPFASGDFSIALSAVGDSTIHIISNGLAGTPAAGGSISGDWPRPE